MKITVITVVYNGEDTIEDTIRSVRAQSHPDIEYIIVDGNSTDGTLKIIEKHKDKVNMSISEPDNGLFHAMNKGIALASGDVIGFLNSDDIYEHRFVIEKIHDAFVKNDIDACYGNLIYVSNDEEQNIVRYWKSRPYTSGLCRKGWMPAHPTLFVKREILKRAGGFNLQYNYQADFDLCLRLFEIEKIRSMYLPEILVRMRMGGVSNNSFLNILNGNLEAYRSCKKHFPQTSPLFIPRKIMSRFGQFVIRP